MALWGRLVLTSMLVASALMVFFLVSWHGRFKYQPDSRQHPQHAYRTLPGRSDRQQAVSHSERQR